jgi:RNA polymerase sigma-70 factor (ECF subfamily)
MTRTKKRWREDEQVLERLRAGDREARREMVIALWGEAMGYARHLLGPDQDLEEVVQEAFAAALEALPRFRGRSRVKTWLFSILHNKVSDHIAARSRARGREESLDEDPLAGAFDERGAWKQPPADRLPGPEAKAYGAELRESLSEAVGRLPQKQRQVFLLRDVRGFTGQEACNILAIKPTHQRVLLHRARLALRAALLEAGHGL